MSARDVGLRSVGATLAYGICWPQVLLRAWRRTNYSVIATDKAFKIGFCMFVLSNYMKALPIELTEAARTRPVPEGSINSASGPFLATGYQTWPRRTD